MADTGLLAAISPELAAQRGIPQNKVPGEDLWDHTLRSVDAAPAGRPVVRLAALLHDIGKPATFADGHFLGHDAVGAELAGAFLDRLRVAARGPRPRRRARPPAHVQLRAELVRRGRAAVHRQDGRHRRRARSMSCSRCARPTTSAPACRPAPGDWTSCGRGSARRAGRRGRARRRGLAVDGGDLIAELGLTAGPRLGRILDELLERGHRDPALNDRAPDAAAARPRACCGRGGR